MWPRGGRGATAPWRMPASAAWCFRRSRPLFAHARSPHGNPCDRPVRAREDDRTDLQPIRWSTAAMRSHPPYRDISQGKGSNLARNASPHSQVFRVKEDLSTPVMPGEKQSVIFATRDARARHPHTSEHRCQPPSPPLPQQLWPARPRRSHTLTLPCAQSLCVRHISAMLQQQRSAKKRYVGIVDCTPSVQTALTSGACPARRVFCRARLRCVPGRWRWPRCRSSSGW